MEEYNLEVDENDNVIGSKPRSYFYDNKGIHRSVVLLLFNSKNQILLQKRSMTKKWYPGLWTASVAGTVASETCDESIVKETREEIGLEITPEFLFKYSFFDNINRSFFYVYIYLSDKTLTPDSREMDEVKWVDVEYLRKDILINSEKYAAQFVYGIKMYFDKYYEK